MTVSINRKTGIITSTYDASARFAEAGVPDKEKDLNALQDAQADFALAIRTIREGSDAAKIDEVYDAKLAAVEAERAKAKAALPGITADEALK